MASMFRGIIEFFEELGVYDVVLPFLLVFSISFAILEKTKIFGTIKIDDIEYTRKNYNALVAFCLGFFVVASTKLVAIINEGLANVTIIIVAFVAFLMTVGIFYGENDDIFSDDTIVKIRPWIVGLTFFAMTLIFLNVIEDDNGNTWFEICYDFIRDHWNSNLVGSIILLGIIVGFMAWITKTPQPKSDGDSDG